MKANVHWATYFRLTGNKKEIIPYLQRKSLRLWCPISYRGRVEFYLSRCSWFVHEAQTAAKQQSIFELCFKSPKPRPCCISTGKHWSTPDPGNAWLERNFGELGWGLQSGFCQVPLYLIGGNKHYIPYKWARTLVRKSHSETVSFVINYFLFT